MNIQVGDRYVYSNYDEEYDLIEVVALDPDGDDSLVMVVEVGADGSRGNQFELPKDVLEPVERANEANEPSPTHKNVERTDVQYVDLDNVQVGLRYAFEEGREVYCITAWDPQTGNYEYLAETSGYTGTIDDLDVLYDAFVVA